MAQKAAKAGVWNWDAASGRLILSPELYAIIEKTPKESEDPVDLWKTLIHPEDRKSSRLRLERALAGRIPFEDEVRILRPGDKCAGSW